MKAFYSVFVALMSASFSFAISDSLKRHYYNSCLNELNILKKECYVYPRDYSTTSELNNKCNVNNSQKCQNFFRDPIRASQMCVLASPYRAIPTSDIRERYYLNAFFCEKTKNGDFCPALQMYLKKDYSFEQKKEIIIKNCKFSNCNESYFEILKLDYAYAKNGEGNLDRIQSLIDIVLSNECKGIKKTTTKKTTTTTTITTTTTTTKKSTTIKKTTTKTTTTTTTTTTTKKPTTITTTTTTTTKKPATTTTTTTTITKKPTTTTTTTTIVVPFEQVITTTSTTSTTASASASATTIVDPSEVSSDDEPTDIELSSDDDSSDDEPTGIQLPSDDDSSDDEPAFKPSTTSKFYAQPTDAPKKTRKCIVKN